MSGSTNQDLDKAFLSIISDFENTLRLDDTTMDEAAVDRKILDHAEVQKKLNRTMFQGLPKMNFGNQPTFSAKDTENVEEWLGICEKNLRLNREDGQLVVEVASSYLRDKAERAYLQASHRLPNMNWEQFKETMIKSFMRRDQIEVNMTKFRGLSQTGDLKEYIDEFNSCLLNLKEELPEAIL
ncbi:hypothetical protein BpHYR1_040136 [Brachionus plicatilis]|uniref:Retrotransposon gag domain-containing protein n=2 Tax=Brachionus plicatilis TaxID=10195 RepID=A0A3M7QXV6_BRAPC|nr:hypothetical protein BpHYR1_040136 [Brachionus plicatilis]